MVPLVVKEVEIPGGVTASVTDGIVTVEGPKGKLERSFAHPNITVEKDDQKITVSCEFASGKEQALVGTFASHIANMMTGVTDGFTYQMKIVYSHFPMKVVVKGNELVIENFLGEKHPRTAKLFGDVSIQVKGETVTVEGINREEVGQTAANIEYATRVRKRDIRVFQDGIYITSKGA
jgi:large subunit ribosomal protein L6